MAITSNVLLLSQSAVYTVTATVSLCVWIPMSLHVYNFCGHCSLFTDGQFIEEDGRFEANWASTAYCGFTLAVGLIAFMMAFFQMIRKFMKLYKGVDSTFLSAFVETISALTMTVIVLADAVIVTKGFSVWCQSLIQRFDSCETASGVMVIGKDTGIEPKGFFVQLGSVQFGIWTLLVCWVLAVVLATRKVMIYHEKENMIVSMTRERQRHIGSDYMPVRS
ncbi:transmembrane protein 179-like [Oppia nitens]|uniref:transmembrane protein 179-like n=1 Tax=Oppia nitens TaxID=1686743 RepID=UPI0023DAA8C7|nr:transmembrane protein 179-like [Oppia nitens]